MIRLGVHSHLFRGPLAVVAEACRRQALTCVQLTPGFPDLPFQEPGQLTAARCRQAALPFQEAGIAIACLSGYTNLMDPDLERRHKGIMRLHALLRHGRDFGTDRVVTETGTLSPRGTLEPFPPNQSLAAWEELRLIVVEALEVAAGHGVRLLLKPNPGHVLATPEDAVRLYEELQYPQLGFVLDPAHAVLPNGLEGLSETVARVVAQVGDLAPVVHAKDVAEGAGGLATPRAGLGVLDYGQFFRLLRPHQPDAAVILEHVRPEDVGAARAHLERALGLSA
jgi:sugar phosphate isomerase/epimerase